MATVQAHEVQAWLGPAYDDLTPGQVELVRHALQDIEDRYSDPDDEDLRRAAATAAAQWVLAPNDTACMADIASALARARAQEAEARAAARQVALMAISRGWTEAEVARALGVDRMAIRSWLGKR